MHTVRAQRSSIQGASRPRSASDARRSACRNLRLGVQAAHRQVNAWRVAQCAAAARCLYRAPACCARRGLSSAHSNLNPHTAPAQEQQAQRQQQQQQQRQEQQQHTQRPGLLPRAAAALAAAALLAAPLPAAADLVQVRRRGKPPCARAP
jgi:hypothetical protein